MSTPTSDVNANTDALKRGSGGTQADAQKIKSDATGTSYTVPSPVTISVKQVDHLTITGSNPGDHRAPNAGASADPLKGNDMPVRSETGTKGC